jgi:hypothetical protein
MMIFRLLMLVSLLNGLTANAQFTITGHIKDSSGSNVLYAGINLVNDSNRIVQASVSDSVGAFRFLNVASGRYILTGTYVGAKIISQEIVVQGDRVIALTVAGTTRVLREVVVNSTRPLLERKIDRMVFNIENSLAAKGTDLATAIALTPMLKVSENGISIIGKSGVSVMINERMLHLSGPDLINYLKSLRAEDVVKIEVITTPPARYEAQGNSGMINIVLKKNLSLGWSGSVSTSYSQNKYAGYGNNLNINFQSAKLSASVKLRYFNRKGFIEEQNDIVGSGNSILMQFPRYTHSFGVGGNASLEYKAGKNSTIGFVYDEGGTNYKVHIDNLNAYQTNNKTDSVLQTISNNSNPISTRTITLYYDQKLGGSGKKLTTDLNYFSNQPITNIDFQTSSDHSANMTTVKTYSGIRYRIWSAQSDLTLPYKWATVETGAKFTNFNNNSDIRYYNYLASEYKVDPAKSNLFDYNEKNIAGYLSMQKDFTSKWAGKAGLRYEYAIVDGYSPTTNTRSRSDYGKLFPTAYLTYKPTATNTFSLTYSKRINRPNFRAINPFRYYTNPYSYSTGNPLLQPSISHNIEFSWLHKSIFSVTVYAQRLLNGYGYITQVNGPFVIVDAKNYLTQNSIGLTSTLSLKPFNWWETNSYLSYSMTRSGSSVADIITESGSSFNYGTNHTFRVTKKLSTFINFSHSFPTTQGYSRRSAQFEMTTGGRVSTLDNKLQLTASFRLGSIDETKLFYKNYTQIVRADYNYRTLTLSATYLFGRSKVKGNTKKVDFKETQRAN